MGKSKIIYPFLKKKDYDLNSKIIFVKTFDPYALGLEVLEQGSFKDFKC